MESQKIGLFRPALDVVGFSAGQTVFKPGDPGDLPYVVPSGEREVLYNRPRLETLGEGNSFGEMSLINEEPRSVSIVARTDVRRVPIDLKHFMFLVEETPYFAVQVMKIMSSRIRKMLSRIEPAKVS